MRGAAPGIDNPVLRPVPILLVLLLSLLAILPLRIPELAAVTPLFALMGIYHWTIYRPELLPPAAVFAIGLIEDLVGGALPGVSGLMLLIAQTVILGQRSFFVGRSFPFFWVGFVIVAAGASAFLWLVGSILGGAVLDPRDAAFQAVLSVVFFPVASFALGRIQHALFGRD